MAKLKFNHPVYISEQEICDTLEAYLRITWTSAKLIREFEIGRSRFDFLALYPKAAAIIEVKQTATLSSILQVQFYKSLLENTLYYQNLDKEVHCSIACRYVDNDALALCPDLDISIWKLDFNDSKELINTIDPIDYEGLTDNRCRGAGATFLKNHYESLGESSV